MTYHKMHITSRMWILSELLYTDSSDNSNDTDNSDDSSEADNSELNIAWLWEIQQPDGDPHPSPEEPNDASAIKW